MRSVRSKDDLRELALRMGAEARINGEVMNAARRVVDAAPPPPEPPPPVIVLAPDPEPEPEYLTREQVDMLLQQSEERIVRQVQAAVAGLRQVLVSLQPEAPATQPKEWEHQVTYTRDGEIQSVRSVSR